MISATVEDYLKQMYLQQQGGEPVSTGRLAAALRVTPGTATAMVKSLARTGLVRYEARRGSRLTGKGSRLALDIVRRHRLLELFLVRVVGLDWSEVHQEAERLEHAISPRVLERIDLMLGRPALDPHGDPIPNHAGEIAARRLRRLADCEPPCTVTVARIVDQDPEFLRFAEEKGLTPGGSLRLQSHDRQAGAVTVRPRGRAALVLATAVARRVLVNE
jgi:DtxR family Mn-dependent transcriptional regulator